jgi:hypothetical protein
VVVLEPDFTRQNVRSPRINSFMKDPLLVSLGILLIVIVGVFILFNNSKAFNRIRKATNRFRKSKRREAP